MHHQDTKTQREAEGMNHKAGARLLPVLAFCLPIFLGALVSWWSSFLLARWLPAGVIAVVIAERRSKCRAVIEPNQLPPRLAAIAAARGVGEKTHDRVCEDQLEDRLPLQRFQHRVPLVGCGLRE